MTTPSKPRRISILLPFRNAETTLRDAASSVLSEMDPDDDELVLIDDGSTDGGLEIARALARQEEQSTTKRNVTIVQSGGVGIAAALSKGLAHCSPESEFIGRMDADDLSLEGRLHEERLLLEAHPSLGTVATQIELFGSPGEGIARYAAWQNGLITAEDHARAIFIEAPVCHPSTMIRRRALDAVGGYREGPFAEDYDLWLRLADADWGIAKVPRVLFRWHIHEANLTWTDPRLSPEHMRRLRATYLAKRIKLGSSQLAIWGAGMAGRRLARELETHALRTSFFIDIDPKKIGRTAREAPILGMDDGIARSKAERGSVSDDADQGKGKGRQLPGTLLIVAVAARGARDLVRAKLDGEGFIEGRDYLCAI